jgi:hypothetical protein
MVKLERLQGSYALSRNIAEVGGFMTAIRAVLANILLPVENRGGELSEFHDSK